MNGFQTPLRRKFHKLKVLIHLWFSLPPLIKPSGKHKDFQLIEFLLKTPPLLFLATDIHSLLILNFKVRNGLRVKKEVK